MKIRLLLPADREFANAVLWYFEESPPTARRFKKVIEEALRSVGRDPTRYRRYRERMRVKIVQGFPFSIYFTIDPQEIVIVAIAHDSRDPVYWQDRV